MKFKLIKKSRFRFSLVDLMMFLTALAMLVGLISLLAGCLPTSGLQSDVIVKHPDAPMLIEQVDGDRLRVAIYDAENNRMIEYGWISTEQLAGWSMMKYDWQEFMAKKKAARAGG